MRDISSRIHEIKTKFNEFTRYYDPKDWYEHRNLMVSMMMVIEDLEHIANFRQSYINTLNNHGSLFESLADNEPKFKEGAD